MPIDGAAPNFFVSVNLTFIIKFFLILFVLFYLIFAFTLFRQIQWMTRRLPTPTSPLLRFVAIVNIGVAFAILLFIIGLF